MTAGGVPVCGVGHTRPSMIAVSRSAQTVAGIAREEGVEE
jgi:hypothetical protein